MRGRPLAALLLLLPLLAGPLRAQVDTTRADSVRADSARADSARADTLAAPPDVLPGDEAVDTLDIDALPVVERVQELAVETGPGWQLSYFPYPSVGSNKEFLLAGRIRYWQPAEYADRVTYRGALSVDGGVGVKGSRFLRASFDAPLLARRWRAHVSLSARREARFSFFGLGNETGNDEDLVTDTDPFYYRMERTRYRAQAQVARYLRGPFLVVFHASAHHVRFGALPATTLFRQTYGSELEEDDVTGGVSLVLDTRNNEYNTTDGLLAEAGVQLGTGGNGYTRYFGEVRGFRPLREGTILAGRLAGSYMAGTPPLDARLSIPFWGEFTSIYGGKESNRGVDRARFVGKHTLFSTVEVRHDLFALGELGAASLIGFVDAGRVFEPAAGEEFELSFDGWHVGGGGGLAIRLLRSTIFVFNVAGGADGVNFTAGSGWMF